MSQGQDFDDWDKRLHADMSAFGTEGVKAILLVNGGAAVALIAILPNMWGNNLYLSVALLVGFAFFAVGVCSAAYLNFSRIEAFDAIRAKDQERAHRENKRFGFFLKLEFWSFGFAVLFIIIGSATELFAKFYKS